MRHQNKKRVCGRYCTHARSCLIAISLRYKEKCVAFAEQGAKRSNSQTIASICNEVL